MWKLEVLGIIVHCMLLVSIFDIYKESFHSSEATYPKEAVADRVVMFVLTGLRPDIVYSTVKEIKTIPLWNEFKINGIIQSEVPTTSKNGFIALTTGINEGLLTVVPINRNIDTIFDRVNKTLYFGPKKSLDFSRGTTWTELNYNIDLNNHKFNDNDETIIKVQLSVKEIKESKIILIHLLRIIQSANTYECLYYQCVDIVVNLFDQIDGLYRLIENQMNNTAYLLIADHGMTKTGQFGGNTIEESETFLAIWGNGVAKADKVVLKQIQIANLISTLLGTDLPRNSLAKTPVSLLNISNEEKQLQNIYNALHLASIAIKSTKQIELVIKFLKYLSVEPFNGYNKMIEYEQIIRNSLKTNNVEGVKGIYEELEELSLYGIGKMKKIMSRMLFYLVNFTNVGWIVLIITWILNYYHKKFLTEDEKLKRTLPHKMKNKNWTTGLNTFFLVISILSFIFVVAHSWPIHYYFYWLLPMFIWYNVVHELYKWKYVTQLFTMNKLPEILLNLTLLILVYELLVWGLRYKFFLLIALSGVTIFLSIKCMLTTSSAILLLSITMSGLFLAISPFIPVQTKEINPYLLNLSGLIWIAAGIILTFQMRFTFLDYITTLLSIVHHICSLILMNIVFIRPNAKESYVTWYQLSTAILIPMMGGVLIMHRIKQLAICIASIFLLFSIRHESIVLFTLFIKIICWLLLENGEKKTPIKTNIDLPIIFTILILSSYYIMGNSEDLNFIDARFMNRFFKEHNQLYEYILLTVKHCLVLFVIQLLFTTIITKRGEDVQFIVAILLLNFIGYRYIIQLLVWPDFNNLSKQLTRHCLIQITITFLLVSFTLTKLITRISIITIYDKIKKKFKCPIIKKEK